MNISKLALIAVVGLSAMSLACTSETQPLGSEDEDGEVGTTESALTGTLDLTCPASQSRYVDTTFTNTVYGTVTARWCAPTATEINSVGAPFTLKFNRPVALPSSSAFTQGINPGSVNVSCNSSTYTCSVGVRANLGCSILPGMGPPRSNYYAANLRVNTMTGGNPGFGAPKVFLSLICPPR